jgi:diguanylate cyclase (GGDEF)-like protein
MTALPLVLLFALLSFGLCMGALSLQRRLGLLPLLLVLALLEGFKYFVAAYIVIELPGLGGVELGSLVSYVNLLVCVQAVYIRLGAGATRQITWSLVAISLLTSGISALLALLVQQPGVTMLLPLDARVLLQSGWVLLLGNTLLLTGLLASVVLAQALLRRGWGLWPALVLSLQTVMLVDTLLFQLLMAGPEALRWEGGLRANLIGKSLVGLLLGSLAAWWLRDAQRPSASGPAAWELLIAMSFRHRLEELERELQTDALTGVFNRRYLERAVPDVLRLDRQRGHPTALVLLDLDHFKQLNDRHGHLVGDQALRHVAELLRRGVRHHDSVIRYGGEEFLLVLPGTAAQEAAQLGKQMLAALRAQPMALSDASLLPVSATAGVAAAPVDGDDWSSLLQCADERLYQGKRSGRDQVVG